MIAVLAAASTRDDVGGPALLPIFLGVLAVAVVVSVVLYLRNRGSRK